MIFASIYASLYRVVYISRVSGGAKPLFTLIDDCGRVHRLYPSRYPSESWKIYTGSVATVLTLVAKPGYSRPIEPVEEIWNDCALAELVPADLIGDKAV